MPFKVTGYTRLENRYTIEVQVYNDTVGMHARILIDSSEWNVYFNGRCCDVPRLCTIMDEVNKPCAEMTVETEDATATTVKCAYFSLSESNVHSWVTGCPSNIRHKITRSQYCDEFTLTIDVRFDTNSRGNGTYFGDKMTRVYLNGKGSWAWSDIFLEGNRIKKITWHWHYCATMDKYVKRLSEVWFVNADAEKADTMAVHNLKYDVTGSDIRDIVFNGPATIILWRDGSKTVIKQQKGDKWDPEKAVAMAVMKKVFGTNKTGSNYLEFVKPYIEKALEDYKGCEETTKSPADELIEMNQELIVDMTYKGATKAELVRAIKYSKELIDWLKTPAGGYVKTGSPTELLEKYGIAELRKKYQKG